VCSEELKAHVRLSMEKSNRGDDGPPCVRIDSASPEDQDFFPGIIPLIFSIFPGVGVWASLM
jgi:hypothetical protein